MHADVARAAPAVRGRTLVAMCGGVDSAVAALLVQRAGREAVAVTLELWRDPANDAEASCCSAHAVRLARSVAHRMGLPHLTIDLRAAFAAGVVQPFLAEYAAGRTPNPCVRCNGHVRLDAMLAFADRLGAEDLATGHYARVTPDGLLRSAADPAKDQAYMLAALAPASVARMRFPLGELTKPEVRALARDAGLPVADQRESQDLCFLAGTGQERLPRPPRRRARPAGGDRGPRRAHARRATAASTASRSASARGSASHAEEPLYVLAQGRRRTRSSSGRAPRWPRRRSPCATPSCTGPAARSTRSGCATAPSRWPATRGSRTARCGCGWASPSTAPRPGQVACLLRGDAVVGHGIIAG